MKTAILLVFPLLALGCADCSDGEEKGPDPWTVGEGEPDAGAGEMDAGPPTRDDGLPPAPDMAEPYLPTCVGAKTFALEVAGSDFVESPVVAADRVFFFGGIEGDSVYALREWTEDGFLRHSDQGSGGLIASSDDYVWVSSEQGVVLRLELATNELQPLPEVEVPLRAVAWNYYYAPIRKTADAGRFGWLRQNIIRVVDDLAVDVLADDAVGSPWLTDQVATYEFDSGGTTSIRVHEGGASAELGTGGIAAWPVATDRNVFYLQDGVVHAANFDGSNDEVVLADRFCGPLHANSDSVVTACAMSAPDPNLGRADYLALNATEVWAFDHHAREPRLVATAEGPIYAPVVSKYWIVWAEYDGDLGGQTAVTGRIMVLPRGATVPTEIGLIGAGCPFCGAYWPPPRLVLGENVVAWNYALPAPAEEMFGPRGSFGVALLRECL